MRSGNHQDSLSPIGGVLKEYLLPFYAELLELPCKSLGHRQHIVEQCHLSPAFLKFFKNSNITVSVTFVYVYHCNRVDNRFCCLLVMVVILMSCFKVIAAFEPVYEYLLNSCLSRFVKCFVVIIIR